MARARSPRTPPPLPAADRALLERLAAALSDDERERVLAAALRALDRAGRARLLARLDAATRTALGHALTPPRPRAAAKAAAAVAPSARKLAQDWDRLWREWDAVVAEVGREDGPYLVQEHDWEPPYLDTTAVAKALDAVAARVRPLIPRVVAAQLARRFRVADVLRALDDALYAGLPEGVEPGDDGCWLGPEVTRCLLEWERACAERDGRDVAALLDAVRDLELELEHLALDAGAITRFVLALPEADLRAALASLTAQRDSQRWAEAFAHAHGAWAEVVRALAKRFDRALFAQTSRANIAEDWSLALPLVRAAVQRGDWGDAAALIDQAVRARLGAGVHGRAARWDPRAQLLAHVDGYYAGADPGGKFAALLELWKKTAAARAQPDLAAALEVQIRALRGGERGVEHGDAMLEAFRAVPPAHRAVHDALFADWRAVFAELSLQSWGDVRAIPCGGWVAALVDAARVGGDAGAHAFHAAVRAALDEGRGATMPRPRPLRELAAADADSRGPLFALALLTLDLDAAAPALKRDAPALYRLLTAEVSAQRGPADATRRAWCARLDGAALVPLVAAFWRENAVRFVPEPTADYARSAEWVAAVHQIAPDAAARLLARWAVDHRLKRNLWREVAHRGLALPAGVSKAPPARGARRG